MNAPVLRAAGLVKSFGAVEVIRGVDAGFDMQRRHLVIGPNGAGKTTFFNLLNGQIAPSAGRVEFLGQDVTALPVRDRARRGLGRTFQIASLFQELSVLDNLLIAAGAPARGADRPVQDIAQEALDASGLAARRGHAVRALSYGEQRRLEIGMSLATAPKLLLLDEPMAGLTQDERRALATRIRELSRTTGIVMIEHDLDIALELAETLTVLHLGQIVASGGVEEVMRDPFVREIYLG